ncbi:ATP synthase F1 subunit delta [Weissella halotolerans]|uniref:ATP synthase subunit delta n=1 Tax=Weissella halotolerans DSM 20190 TaxID=1123500 RepID=A0A0R2G466_9LACO|nr:ATP synthase F1 subunit delta [Weissella halotolerans]KRN32279.1 F0F1 ATP synthase subunit delta [Weissella halotolerans DSM 20190]
MAMNRVAVAKRYAVALFELTHAQGTDETTASDLQAVLMVIQTDPTLMKALTAPNITENAKQNLLKTLGSQSTDLVQRLLALVYTNGRITLLPVIIDQYQQLIDQSIQHVRVEVTTAIPLTSDQETKLTEKLKQQFAAKSISLDQVVDEHILGGVIVKARNQVLDGSLATKLATIHQKILS